MSATNALQELQHLPSKRLEGKVAIITGGDQGIGKAIALRLAAEGADIAFCYRKNRAGADEVVAQISSLERQAFAGIADLSDTAQVRGFVEETFKRYGRVNILVNNAGLEKSADFWNVTEQDYDQVMNVNVRGLFFTTQAVVRQWLDTREPGRIVNISSVHEELPFPHFAAYCASKGAVKMLTRNLAVELAPYGITINSIAPGAIETPINKALLQDPQKLSSLLQNIPLKRLGTTDDVAGVAAFLVSSDASYITGTTVFVDGGLLWAYEEQ
jgi:glucose 1-dehydrogenase